MNRVSYKMTSDEKLNRSGVFFKNMTDDDFEKDEKIHELEEKEIYLKKQLR